MMDDDIMAECPGSASVPVTRHPGARDDVTPQADVFTPGPSDKHLHSSTPPTLMMPVYSEVRGLMSYGKMSSDGQCARTIEWVASQ